MIRFALPLLLSVAALACPRSPAADPARPRSLRLPAGAGPGSVAIADLNGDRRADIVVANEESDDVTILLGDGRGGFTRAKGSPFPAGNCPNDVAIGDFNGDGRPDLAVPNHETHHVTVLLGDGSGSFSPSPRSPVPVRSRPHPHGLAVGDFNGDGALDLVTESWEQDRLELLLGDGRGGFATSGALLPTGRMPYQKVRAGDLNKDGQADIVTTNHRGESVTVLLADRGGRFREAPGSPLPVGRSPFFVAISDIDRDGDADLAVAHYSGSLNDPSADGVTLLLGDGTGRFEPMTGRPLRAGRAPTCLAIGDVSGDGWADVVTANLGGDDVTVLLGTGKGTLEPGPTWPVGRGPQGIAAADLDGDGRADIVTANGRDDDVTVLLTR